MIRPPLCRLPVDPAVILASARMTILVESAALSGCKTRTLCGYMATINRERTVLSIFSKRVRIIVGQDLLLRQRRRFSHNALYQPGYWHWGEGNFIHWSYR